MQLWLQVDSSESFGPSLSSCPQLETFSSYKLHGLHLDNERCHKLILPSCTSLSLHRSDTLERLHVTAPKLIRLNLQVSDTLHAQHSVVSKLQVCMHSTIVMYFQMGLPFT